MSLPLPATNEQVEASRAWVRAFYEGAKSTDLQSWLTKFYQTDAILNFGNQPPLKGYKEISDYFENVRAHLSIAKHDIVHVDVFSDRIYALIKDTFIVNNDSEQKEIIIKALVLIWKKVDQDKLSSIDVFTDPTPLNERIKLYS